MYRNVLMFLITTHVSHRKSPFLKHQTLMIIAPIKCIHFSDCGCDHSCVPKNGESFVCVCRDGYTLDSDGKTCGKCRAHLPTGQSLVIGTA